MIQTLDVNVHAVFTRECLGAQSGNPDITRTHLDAKRKKELEAVAPERLAEEDAALPELTEEERKQQKTYFHRDDDGCPVLFDHVFTGYLKEAQGAFNRVLGKENAMKAYKTVIDGLVMIYPMKIRLNIPSGLAIGECERIIRISGPSGIRTVVAVSESVPAGTWFEFTIRLLNPALKDAIVNLLDYGQFKGLGQWRNSGRGRFEYQVIEKK